MKKFLVFLTLIILLTPAFSFAQESTRLVPCNGVDCDFNDLIQLVKNIIEYIILISAPIAAIVIAYAGFIIMTSSISDKISKAKGIMMNVAIGFAFILGAWVIVNTILVALLNEDFKNIIQLG